MCGVQDYFGKMSIFLENQQWSAAIIPQLPHLLSLVQFFKNLQDMLIILETPMRDVNVARLAVFERYFRVIDNGSMVKFANTLVYFIEIYEIHRIPAIFMMISLA